jgi:hypothetical protein
MLMRKCLVAAYCFSVAASLCVDAARAQVFEPDEQRVSRQLDMLDGEFNQARAQYVWCDSVGRLWVANVNRNTGLLEPANGKGTLVDAAALSTQDMQLTYNGPEWVSAAGGDRIVYTKFPVNVPHTLGNARLASARETAPNTWAVEMLPSGLARNAPYASHDADDPRPRISYVGLTGLHYWRELDLPSSEEPLPNLPASPRSVRFVDGARAVVYPLVVNGISQVFRYDLDSKALEQLTFDEGDKDLETAPWIWQAPELGGAETLLTVVNYSELRIYVRTVDAHGASVWVRGVTHGLGATQKVTSPEPFVYGGRSYVFFAVASQANGFPSDIWLVDIDEAAPMMRRLNDDQQLRARIDPEVFITDAGPYIYFNRYNATKVPGKPYCGTCAEGLYRAYTGLAPP